MSITLKLSYCNSIQIQNKIHSYINTSSEPDGQALVEEKRETDHEFPTMTKI